MAKVVKGLFGGGSGKKERAAREQDAAEARRAQEAQQNQALQQQGQQAAETDKQLARGRSSRRGRRLLMDTGAGKMTVG